MISFKALSIGRKLATLVGVATLGYVAIIAVALVDIHSSLMNDRRVALKNLVESSATIVRTYVDRAARGEMPVADAQKQAAETLRMMRYDGRGNYFFILDFDARTIMHGADPKQDGKDMSGLKDARGEYPFRMVSAIGRQGEGFVAYHWMRPDSRKPVPKLSYVVGIPEWQWSIGTGVYIDDVTTMFLEQAAQLVGVSLLVLLLMGALALAITRDTTRGVRTLTREMTVLSSGSTDLDIAGADRADEIGEMSRAVLVFRDRMIENAAMQATQEADRQHREARAQRIEDLAQMFDSDIATVLSGVSSSATQLESTAQQMATISQQTSSQATSVAAAAEEASANVQTVASAAEQLSASIRSITDRVGHASTIAQTATRQVQHTNDQVARLSQAAHKIGEVVALITSIADQTNLLALNATIEAARAGDAGKGFAVVANEVKTLATQTSRATDEIRTQIDEVQGQTGLAVEAIRQIGAVIDEVNSISVAITSAVEEQDHATREIAHSVEQASAGTQDVTRNIHGVTSAARHTGEVSGEVLNAAGQLAGNAETLKALVDRFLADVRAA